MKIYVYEAREDETEYLKAAAEKTGAELTVSSVVPSPGTAGLAEGCDGVSILGQGDINAEVLDAWHRAGVRYVSTRTIGSNHIDLKHASAIGMRVCNSSYAPNGVADFTIMLMLMCMRNYKQALWRGQVNDFSLHGLEGHEMRNMTVGVVGAGRIGSTVLQSLTGFGCRLLAYNASGRKTGIPGVEDADLETLYRECDILTYHVPLTDATYHMINRESIAKMKDGVIIINCARGGLADVEALIDGIESEKIGALGLDVIEGEEGITHVDHRIDILSNKNSSYLRQFRNVIMTPHMAFYTDSAVESMVNDGIEGLCSMYMGRPCKTELK